MYLHARDHEDEDSRTETAVSSVGHTRGNTGLLVVLLVLLVLLGPAPPDHRLHSNHGTSEVDRPVLGQEQPLVMPRGQGSRARLVQAHQEAVQRVVPGFLRGTLCSRLELPGQVPVALGEGSRHARAEGLMIVGPKEGCGLWKEGGVKIVEGGMKIVEERMWIVEGGRDVDYGRREG